MGEIKEQKKGTILIRNKETDSRVYIQLSGKSMIYNLTHEGKRKILFIFGEGVLLNEHIFENHQPSINCELLEDGQILSVPKSVFCDCMKKDFELTKYVIEMQEWKNWRMGHQLKNTYGGLQLERKLASKLWKLSRDFGKKTEYGIEIDIDMTITFLADMLGAPRETTSRICSKLAEKGLIRMEKKRITILNSEQMGIFYKTGEIL
jgi:CRP-like cAMP-binding protein